MFIYALQITWLRKLLTNENKYSSIVKELVPDIYKNFKYGNVF